MRYMIMHKTTEAWEAGEKPTPKLAERVGAMVDEMNRAGVLLAGEGLGPSSEGARVRLKDQKVTVTPGPFSPQGALPSRYMIFRAATVDRAAEVAARFGRVFGDVVIDVRPVNEPWDLGFSPKPGGLLTRRYMAVVNADASSEAGEPLTAAQRAMLQQLTDDSSGDDSFLALEHFEPSRRAKRLAPAKGSTKATHVVLDGPFTETKELIGGFVIVDVRSIDDAVGWARKYTDSVGAEEVDVRGLLSM